MAKLSSTGSSGGGGGATVVHGWLPLIHVFLSATLCSASDLCYKVEWALDTSAHAPPTLGIQPITAMPPQHPSVVHDLCGTSLEAGDPIPTNATGVYQISNQGGMECKTLSSPQLFYGYSYPHGASANTGYEAVDQVQIYLIVDAASEEFLIIILDKAKAGNTNRSWVDLSINSTGLPPDGTVQIQLFDDWSERAKSSWDGQHGEFHWAWAFCCTDGVALGPLPQTAWTMTFAATSFSPNMQILTFDSWSDAVQDVGWVSVAMSDVGLAAGGVRLSTFTCAGFCDTFATCGECTATSYCSWCGTSGSCLELSSSFSCPAPDWTPPGTCCAGCVGKARSECEYAGGCCFCLDSDQPYESEAGQCISGTAQTTCSPCQNLYCFHEDPPPLPPPPAAPPATPPPPPPLPPAPPPSKPPYYPWGHEYYILRQLPQDPIYYLLLTTYYLLLTTHYLLCTTYYLLLTTYYILLTIYYILRQLPQEPIYYLLLSTY